MKKTILTALAAAAIAVGAQAQSTTVKLEPGVPYTFTSEDPATGSGAITYQWYRNNVAINGATGATYTLPGTDAHGVSVEFKRGAKAASCSGFSYSNIYVVTFCLNNLTVGNICWADANIGNYQTFAPRADMYTKFYQWNKTTEWAAAGSVSGWPSANTSATWTVNPCPAGWRLPTYAEAKELNDGGSVRADVNSGRGNAVAGRFYGPNRTTCTLPNNMTNCIFLPACGRRNASGTLGYQNDDGRYWTSTQYSSSAGYTLHPDYSANSSAVDDMAKSWGGNIRCVN